MVNFPGSGIMSPVLESVEPVHAASASVSCDGDGESQGNSHGNPQGNSHGNPNGHPKVYLKIGDSGEVVCPYCSRRFVLMAEGAKTASGH